LPIGRHDVGNDSFLCFNTLVFMLFVSGIANFADLPLFIWTSLLKQTEKLFPLKLVIKNLYPV